MLKDALILAAGEGTRLHPLTLTRSKVLLPLGGKPLIRWMIDSLRDAGVENVFVIVGKDDKGIRAYLGDETTYIIQENPQGTADAIGKAEGYIKRPFICVNGDVVFEAGLFTELARAYEEKKTTIMTGVESATPHNYGVLETNAKGKLIGIVEKPQYPKGNLINAGAYVFGPEIFSLVNKTKKSERGEYEITDTIRMCDTFVLRYTGFWQDLGKPWDLLAANEFFMRKLKGWIGGTVEERCTLKGEVYVGEGSVVKSGAYIEGPAYIGKNCRIGPNCYIRPYTALYDNVHIGNAVEVKNSIVMGGSNIPHLSYVGDSIIGQNCNLGAGTNIANLRFDDGEVKLLIKGSVETSGRRKFGCVLGDGVKTGINVSILPGRKIYPNKTVKPGETVFEDIF